MHLYRIGSHLFRRCRYSIVRKCTIYITCNGLRHRANDMDLRYLSILWPSIAFLHFSCCSCDSGLSSDDGLYQHSFVPVAMGDLDFLSSMVLCDSKVGNYGRRGEGHRDYCDHVHYRGTLHASIGSMGMRSCMLLYDRLLHGGCAARKRVPTYSR